MQITGDPNPLDRPLNVPVDQVGDIYIVDGGSSPIQKFSRNCSVYVADRSNLSLQVFDTINWP